MSLPLKPLEIIDFLYLFLRKFTLFFFFMVLTEIICDFISTSFAFVFSSLGVDEDDFEFDF